MTTLDKVKRLEQYLAANDSGDDPVLDTTIDKLLARERVRLKDVWERLQQQCKQFEKKYSLESSEFYNRYEKGEAGDKIDFVEWASTVEMLANIEERFRMLDT